MASKLFTPKPLADDRDLWERQPSEGIKPYEAFQIYLLLGAKRSIREVARQLSKQAPLMSRWSAQWSWVRRTDAYDAKIAREIREKSKQEILEMRERHAKIAMAMQQKALARLTQMQPQELSAQDVKHFMAEAVKIERISRGEPDSIQETGGKEDRPPIEAEFIYDNLSDEELDDLERLLSKAAKPSRS